MVVMGDPSKLKNQFNTCVNYFLRKIKKMAFMQPTNATSRRGSFCAFWKICKSGSAGRRRTHPGRRRRQKIADVVTELTRSHDSHDSAWCIKMAAKGVAVTLGKAESKCQDDTNSTTDDEDDVPLAHLQKKLLTVPAKQKKVAAASPATAKDAKNGECYKCMCAVCVGD